MLARALQDHKPNNPEERQRLEGAGSEVRQAGRLPNKTAHIGTKQNRMILDCARATFPPLLYPEAVAVTVGSLME